MRDWLYISDHCAAIRRVLEKGRLGEVYNIGGDNEKSNLEVVNTLCTILDKIAPREDRLSYQTQITHITDRAGHDRRYAIDATKITQELGWKALDTFESGIQKTVEAYLSHQQEKIDS